MTEFETNEKIEALEKQVEELEAILTYIVSQHNSGNLPLIEYEGRTYSGKYYDIEIIKGKLLIVNLEKPAIKKAEEN